MEGYVVENPGLETIWSVISPSCIFVASVTIDEIDEQ